MDERTDGLDCGRHTRSVIRNIFLILVLLCTNPSVNHESHNFPLLILGFLYREFSVVKRLGMCIKIVIYLFIYIFAKYIFIYLFSSYYILYKSEQYIHNHISEQVQVALRRSVDVKIFIKYLSKSRIIESTDIPPFRSHAVYNCR